MFGFRLPAAAEDSDKDADTPGFRVNETDDVPGFRVGLVDDVPGFRVDQTDDTPGFRMKADNSLSRDPQSGVGAANFAGTIFQSAGGPASLQTFSDHLKYFGDGSEGSHRNDLLSPLGAPDLNPSQFQLHPSNTFGEPLPDGLYGDTLPWPNSSNPYFGTGSHPQFTSLGSLAGQPQLAQGRTSVSPFASSTFNEGSGDAAIANDVPFGTLPVNYEQEGRSGGDPNVVRVGDDGAVASGSNAQLAQAAPQQPKLRKDSSLGVPVILPDKSNVFDRDSPTGLLMAPTADLGDVAEAGRQAKETLGKLNFFPPAYLAYLAGALGANVGQGGTFDYQRRGNIVTGYTHLPQFVKVSNLNVGLFAQQAGLTLDQTLTIAGEFARLRSSNADEKAPYGLSQTQREYITRGYEFGTSGMFDSAE